MRSSRHLGGVAHNIGSHAISCYHQTYDSIGAACRALDRLSICINLLKSAPGKYDIPEVEKLSFDIYLIGNRFLEILESAGHQQDDVQDVQLTIFFSDLKSYPEVAYCYIALTSWGGKLYEDWIDAIGKRVFVRPGRHKRVFDFPSEFQVTGVPVIYGKVPQREPFSEWLTEQRRLLRTVS